MAKTAKTYIDVHPWIIRETGFHPEKSQVSESIFSLANEFMGLRGYFEEGYSGDSFQGSYFNGIYEKGTHHYATKFKGFADEWTFMVNAVDWLYTRITLDGEPLDLARCSVDEFVRTVDMRRGVLERSFIWHTASGKRLRLTFERFLSMTDPHLGMQMMCFEPLNFSGQIEVKLGLDFGTLYNLKQIRPWCIERHEQGDWTCALAKTESSGHRLFSAFKLQGKDITKAEPFMDGRVIGKTVQVELTQNKPSTLEKTVVNTTEKDTALDNETVWQDGCRAAAHHSQVQYPQAKAAHEAYWTEVWSHLDLTVEGDDENQQGFRYCMFHLHQTYHGSDSRFNVGAKGLTGEHYWGVSWWDTETYCLPFYLFNNRDAAKNLIDYRYRTLPEAKIRARQLGLEGARYPMCTIDGQEVCNVWQHGDLEIHVSAAVAYGVWKYHHITGDDAFLFEKGAEMLVEITRFYASRGGWGQETGLFGFWGVMGADEMHMMVNNNFYTNLMAKKSFQWALQTLDRMETECPERFDTLVKKVDLKADERADWRHKADHMDLMYDEAKGVYEQHEGFFNLPHIDYHRIPDEQFPVQRMWPYVDLFRFDLIKQPDVLLAMFLFGSEFDDDLLRRNFDYYEPRCSHESSLSPAIHSILAARLGDTHKASDYARYASRLDLDDYNNNTKDGLHVTSMAAAWMNLVYGFGGLKSDGQVLSLAPSCPAQWTSFSFKLYTSATDILTVRVDHEKAVFQMTPGSKATVQIYGDVYDVSQRPVEVTLKSRAAAAHLKAVVFDLDGVIVDTATCHYKAWKVIADREGIYFDEAINERLKGISRMDSLEVLLERANRHYTDEQKAAMAAAKNALYVDMLDTLTADDILPGIGDLLDDLEKNHIKTAICSASKNTLTILQKLGLEGRFDAVVTGHDVTASKPDPQGVNLAVSHVGVPPNHVVLVEDAFAGIEAGRRAGVKTMGIGDETVLTHADGVLPQTQLLTLDRLKRLFQEDTRTLPCQT